MRYLRQGGVSVGELARTRFSCRIARTGALLSVVLVGSRNGFTPGVSYGLVPGIFAFKETTSLYCGWCLRRLASSYMPQTVNIQTVNSTDERFSIKNLFEEMYA